MAIIGYARVSTTDQSLDVQTDKLAKYPCDKIYKEKASAVVSFKHVKESVLTKNLNLNRTELTHCLDYLREGDTLVITKLDRIARSTLHLCQIMDLLEKKKVHFIAIDQSIDTKTPTGRLLIQMLGVIAEFEASLRRDRQLEGLAKAKANNTRLGRERSITISQQKELISLRETGISIGNLAKEFKISRMSVYRYLNINNAHKEYQINENIIR